MAKDFDPSDDPALGPHTDQHPADCGCALPPEVLMTCTVFRNGAVSFGRRITRPNAIIAMEQVLSTLRHADEIDAVEREMDK